MHSQALGLFSLGTTNLLEGPGAGSDSVVLAASPSTAAWTASTNASWLHLSVANQSGVGSTNVVFSFDANPGATRSGVVTVGGKALTVTQAGATYVSAGVLTTLVSSNLNRPISLAVDAAGNVFICDENNSAIKEWVAASNSLVTVVSGLGAPASLALDASTNIYIADAGNYTILKYNPVSNNLSTVVSQYTGISFCEGVALDPSGNLYIADTGHGMVKELPVGGSSLLTLASGYSFLEQMSADAAGNVYLTDFNKAVVDEYVAGGSNVVTLIPSVQYKDAKVDGTGSLYVMNDGGPPNYSSSVIKHSAVNGNLTSVVPAGQGLFASSGLALDATGNIYIADFGNNAIKELPVAFVDPTAKSESGAAGSDVLPAVLPVTENLNPPFAPTSDQSWLTIGGITNGVVSFSFSANNSGSNRTANISLLGKTIAVNQSKNATITRPTLVGLKLLSKGVLQFSFTNTQTTNFTLLSSTNAGLALSNWTVVGTPSNIAPNVFQFTSPATTNDRMRFYTVRSP